MVEGAGNTFGREVVCIAYRAPLPGLAPKAAKRPRYGGALLGGTLAGLGPFDSCPAAATFEGPVIIVQGASAPAASASVLDACGHMPGVECPDPFAEAVRAHFD